MPRVILRNIGILSVQMIASKLLYVVLIAVLSRKLGVEGVASYTFARSFPALLFLFLSWGMSDLMVRELARRTDQSYHYVGALLPLQFFSWVFGFLLTLGLIVILHVDAELVPLIVVAALIILVGSLNMVFKIGFWSREDFHLEAMTVIVSDVIGITLALAFLFRGSGVLVVLIALLAGETCGFLFSGWLFHKRIGIPKLSIDVPLWISLIRGAVPFLLNDILLVTILRLDVVMVGLLTDTETLGLFGATFLVLRSLISIVETQMSVFYPRLSSLWVQDKKEFSRLLLRGFLAIIFLGVTVTVLAVLFAKPFLQLVFGNGFEAAVPILRILLIGGFFLFLLAFLRMVLNATNCPWSNTKVFIFSLVLNLALNLVLIPWHAAVGAAYATTMTYAVTFLIASFIVLRTKLVDKSL